MTHCLTIWDVIFMKSSAINSIKWNIQRFYPKLNYQNANYELKKDSLLSVALALYILRFENAIAHLPMIAFWVRSVRKTKFVEEQTCKMEIMFIFRQWIK